MDIEHGHRLYDWQETNDGVVDLIVSMQADSILITEREKSDRDSRLIWVELQDGVLRVHCYDHRHEEPFNVDIGPEEITAWDNRE